MSYSGCIRAVTAAAGRDLTEDEIRGIFERVHRAALDIKAGRAAPSDVTLGKDLGAKTGVGTSQDQVIQQAAARAAAELQREAAQAERQAYLQVMKLGGRVDAYKRLTASGMPPLKAVENLLFRNFRGVNVESIEQHARGVRDELLRDLMKTWDSLGRDWLGLFQDETKTLTLLKAMRGERTGVAAADQGAKAWLDVNEKGRQLFNDAGGAIGKLENWAYPQHHSQAKAANAAAIVHGTASNDVAINQKAWVDRKMTRIDRAAYVDDLGVPLGEPEIRVILEKAWETVSTNGIANAEPGAVQGIGKRANRHAEHRSIHYKDAESAIADWKEFGDRSVVEILYGHVERMARDIALVEMMGPNDRITWQTMRDMALQDAVKADRKKTNQLTKQADKLDRYYDHATGRTKGSANLTFSGIMDGIAHLNTAAKLGGATIASLFGDRVTYEAVAHLNNVPEIQSWRTQFSLLNPLNKADRAAIQRQGLMLDSVRSGLTRFWDDFGTGSKFSSTTGKWANAVMRVTGMTAINDIPKAAFGVNLFSAIGSELAAGKAFGQLADSDVRLLKNYGITEVDWRTWKLAQLDELAGVKNVLSPDAIGRISDADLKAANIIGQADGAKEAAAARRSATVKLLGAVNSEADFAIVTPGWKERAQFYSGLQRGTVAGEIARSALQFKSFPWAFFQRNLDLIANMEGGGAKAAMAAYLVGATTLAGAMILQTREMLSGKDPRDMTGDKALKFWASAFLQGGALGIYGDFLYSVNQTRYGSGPIEMMMGPTVGPLLELGIVQPLTAAKKAIEGKETHFLAQEFQDLKGFAPGGNIWYAKAALDHLVFQQVMEALSPGYLSSIRSRTMREYGQDWWWTPGELRPDRGPDLERAVSQ